MDFNHFTKYLKSIITNEDVKSRFRALQDTNFQNEILNQLNSLTNQFYYKVDFNYAQTTNPNITFSSNGFTLKSQAKVLASTRKGNLYDESAYLHILNDDYAVIIRRSSGRSFLYKKSDDVWLSISPITNWVSSAASVNSDDNTVYYIYGASFIEDNDYYYIFLPIYHSHIVKVLRAAKSDPILNFQPYAYLGQANSPALSQYDDTNPSDKDLLRLPYFSAVNLRQDGNIDLFLLQVRGYSSTQSYDYSLIHYIFDPTVSNVLNPGTTPFTYVDVILDRNNSQYLSRYGLYSNTSNSIFVANNALIVSSGGVNEIVGLSLDEPHNFVFYFNNIDFSYGNLPYTLNTVRYVTFDPNDKLYYVFFYSHRTVGVFNENFEFVRSFGTPMSVTLEDIPLALSNVHSIEIYNNVIYVLDRENDSLYSLPKDYDQYSEINLLDIPPYPLPASIFITDVLHNVDNLIVEYYIAVQDSQGNPIQWLPLNENLPRYLLQNTQQKFKIKVKFNYADFNESVGSLSNVIALYRIEE